MVEKQNGRFIVESIPVRMLNNENELMHLLREDINQAVASVSVNGWWMVIGGFMS